MKVKMKLMTPTTVRVGGQYMTTTGTGCVKVVELLPYGWCECEYVWTGMANDSGSALLPGSRCCFAADQLRRMTKYDKPPLKLHRYTVVVGGAKGEWPRTFKGMNP